MNDEHLSETQKHVLREKGTEAPFSSDLLEEKRSGVFTCAACGTELFTSDAKFDSGTGWPSFDQPIIAERLELRSEADPSDSRTEVVCKTCGGHLGHVFDDGPTETGARYCINGAALGFNTSETQA